MKKILSLIIIMCLLYDLSAQDRRNKFVVNGEAGVSNFEKHFGGGAFVQGLFGVGKTGFVTLSVGSSKFGGKKSSESQQIFMKMKPILVGYRHHLGKFYIEPQIGAGEISGKLWTNGDFARPSVAAAFAGLAVGYSKNTFTAGTRFEYGRGIEGRSAGMWRNESFYHGSVFIGYNLFYFGKRRPR